MSQDDGKEVYENLKEQLKDADKELIDTLIIMYDEAYKTACEIKEEGGSISDFINGLILAREGLRIVRSQK